MTKPKHENLAAALAAFQAEMPTVAKTKRANVGQYGYNYADLADVTEAAAPILTKHGLAFAGSARHVEGGRYELVGILSHESGGEREGALPIQGGNPQQIGSAITYMRRYLFGVMTGIVTDGDDDGALASAQKEQKQERRRAAATSAAPEPPPDEIPTEYDSAGHVIDVGAGPMKPKTRGQMFVLFNELNITDEDEQRAGISRLVGREVTSRGSLTEAEARTVIKSLQARKGARTEQPA